MNEIAKIILEICVSAILVEITIQIFPDKFKNIVHSTLILAVSITLISGILNLDIEFDTSLLHPEMNVTSSDVQQNIIDCGIELLKERIYMILDTAGISVSENEDGISVRYRIPEENKIEVSGVEVRLRYQSDKERAYALLQGILSPVIPVEVYVE